MPPRNKKPASTDPVTTGTSIPSRPTATSSTSTATPSIRSKQQLSLSRLGSATQELWNSYLANTPNSLLVIDAFLVFLMYVGGVQFVYACLTGGYPFNSFLAGFSQAVGQFVLTEVSPERYTLKNSLVTNHFFRAFADFVFSSIVLHFFAINFLG